MKNYIYARCSTSSGQSTASQILEIEETLSELGVTKTELIEEYISGDTPPERRALNVLIDKCQSGDTIYITKYTRWARNASWGMYMFEKCWKKGVQVYNCDQKKFIEPDPNAPMSKLIIFVELSQGETNLQDIRRGQRSGIRKAKANGVKSGRANKKWCANKTTEEMEQMERERALSIAKTKTFQRLESVQLALIIRAIETAIPQISSCANKGSEFPFLGYEQFRRITMDEWSSIHRTYRAITEGNTNPLVDDKISLQKLKDTYYYVFQSRFKSTAVQFVKY